MTLMRLTSYIFAAAKTVTRHPILPKARDLFGGKGPLMRPFYNKERTIRAKNAGNTYSFNIFSEVAGQGEYY